MDPTRKINVLQLVEGFNLGGAEKKLWELIDHLDRRRFRTVVCSLGLGEEIKKYFEKLGVKIVLLPRRHQFDISLIWRLWKLIREEKIDIVMTTLFYADFLGALVGKAAGAKGVFSWETISAPEWLYPRRLYPYRLVIKFADKVISVSQATAQWLHEKRGVSPRQITVIPYGVDLSLFKPQNGSLARQRLRIGREEKVIGMVGRLHPQKGHVYLIEAAVDVVRQFPSARFVLIGDGPLRHELESMVADKNLKDRCLFLGFRHDVPELLPAFDIFTLPSLYEGLPNVVLEAMACGLPVVATPVDGTKEAVVHDETGLLVPAQDSKRLAGALLFFLKQPDVARRMGQQGRKRVEQIFSLQKQVASFEEIYARYAGHSKSS